MPKAIFIWGMHLRCEALDICYLECVPGGRFSDGLDRNEMPRTEEDCGRGGGGEEEEEGQSQQVNFKSI